MTTVAEPDLSEPFADVLASVGPDVRALVEPAHACGAELANRRLFVRRHAAGAGPGRGIGLHEHRHLIGQELARMEAEGIAAEPCGECPLCRPSICPDCGGAVVGPVGSSCPDVS